LVEALGLSSPTETNDERRKTPLQSRVNEPGLKGFTAKQKKPCPIPGPILIFILHPLELEHMNSSSSKYRARKDFTN
jgi:hypothetical protein